MAPSKDPSPPGGNSPGGKPTRLTEQQKKTNHIVSERRRREAIRDQYQRLSEMVPGMNGQHRSEGVMMTATVDHIEELLQRRRQLLREALARGIPRDTLRQYEIPGPHGTDGWENEPDEVHQESFFEDSQAPSD